MAIEWGAINGDLSVGIEATYSPATITSTTDSVTVQWDFYVRSHYHHFGGDTQKITVTGDVSGAKSYVMTADNTKIVTMKVYSLGAFVTIGNNSTTLSVTATVSGAATGGTPTKTSTITIPARPSDPPVPPTSAVASWASDTQINVSWVRPNGALTGGAAWTGVEVLRRADGNTGPGTIVANLGANALSWADKSVRANHRYWYGVRSKNGAGVSATVWSVGWVYTTPAAPSAVQARREGLDSLITWTDNSAGNATSFEIEDNGVIVGTSTTTTFVHEGITPGTHSYRVRALAGIRTSAWSAYSNTVIPLQAPNAPTALSPSGGVYITGEPVTLSWQHNPTDSTLQTKFEVQWRLVGAPAWTSSGEVASSTQAGVLTPPDSGVVEWQVRTWGQHADPSPWSATSSFTLTTRPVVTIVVPPDGGTYESSELVVQWNYFHAEGNPQGQYYIELREGGLAGPVLEIGENPPFHGDDTTWTATRVVEDTKTYAIRMRVRESSGIWSDWATSVFSVTYPGPTPPRVSSEWRPDMGFIELTLQAGDDGSAPATSYLKLERKIDDGEWELLAAELPPFTTYLDWSASLTGVNTYRVTAISALPSESHTLHSVDMTGVDSCDVYLNGGPGFSIVARLHYVDSKNVQTGRERVLKQFAGRSKPVEFSGIVVSRSLTVSARMIPPDGCRAEQATREELEELFSLPGPHLFRDPSGRRMWCSLSDLQVSYDYLGTVSFTMTEAVGGTSTQLDAIARYTSPKIIEPKPGEYQITLGSLTMVEAGEWVWSP